MAKLRFNNYTDMFGELNNQMITYRVEEGRNAFRPYGFMVVPNARWALPGIHAQFIFDENAVYEFEGNDRDQFDWNKVFGLRFGLLNNRKNSCMIGWRWNADAQVHEFTSYVHRNRERIVGWGGDQVFLKVANGTLVDAYLFPVDNSRKAWCTWLLNGENGNKVVTHFDRRSWAIGRIDAWFGGDDSDGNGIGGKAPKDLSFKMNRRVLSHAEVLNLRSRL